jgi:hypothetical protein
MPVDPSAADWGERLNRYTRHDVLPTEPPAPPSPPPPSTPRGQLF